MSDIYKTHYTLLKRVIHFISPTAERKVYDKKLCEDLQLRFPPNIALFQDLGYLRLKGQEVKDTIAYIIYVTIPEIQNLQHNLPSQSLSWTNFQHFLRINQKRLSIIDNLFVYANSR
jgi:hypothetical protein